MTPQDVPGLCDPKCAHCRRAIDSYRLAQPAPDPLPWTDEEDQAIRRALAKPIVRDWVRRYLDAIAQPAPDPLREDEVVALATVLHDLWINCGIPRIDCTAEAHAKDAACLIAEDIRFRPTAAQPAPDPLREPPNLVTIRRAQGEAIVSILKKAACGITLGPTGQQLAADMVKHVHAALYPLAAPARPDVEEEA